MPTLVEEFFSGQELQSAVNKLPTRAERQAQYRAVMDDLLDPVNGAWPGDDGRSVRLVMRTSPQARAANGLHAKHAIPDGLTTQERRNWLDGLGQIGG